MINKALAHSEVEHESSAESVFHYFEFLLSPYVAIPVFFLVLGLVIIIMHKLNVGLSRILLTVLILTLLSAILGLLFVPQLGLVALTLGFALALYFVLVGVRKQ